MTIIFLLFWTTDGTIKEKGGAEEAWLTFFHNLWLIIILIIFSQENIKHIYLYKNITLNKLNRYKNKNFIVQ